MQIEGDNVTLILAAVTPLYSVVELCPLSNHHGSISVPKSLKVCGWFQVGKISVVLLKARWAVNKTCEQQLEYIHHQVLVTMDGPKLEVSWLEYFPPDIWACIVWYLPGEQLGRLMMTGATLLWRRLKSPHVVKSIKLGQDYLIFKSPPKFLNELPSLDELLIDSRNDEWSRNLGLTIASIPSGVRKLELSGVENGVLIHPICFLKV